MLLRLGIGTDKNPLDLETGCRKLHQKKCTSSRTNLDDLFGEQIETSEKVNSDNISKWIET